MNPAEHDGAGRSRWLHELRARLADQIESCRVRLDEVSAALEDEHLGGPLPIEARAFFMAETAVDLLAGTRYLRRVGVSCGQEAVRRVGDVVFLERCTRLEAHDGDCDPDAASLVRHAEATAFSLLRSTMVAADKASQVALQLDQASFDGTSQVGSSDLAPLRELAQELGTIADGARVLSDELDRAEARLAHDRPTPLDQLAQMGESEPGPAASTSGLEGLG